MQKSVRVRFDYKADTANSLALRLEKAGNPAEKLYSGKVSLGAGEGQFDSGEIGIPGKGRWQLVFYFGKSGKGNIWIDNVEMDFRE